MNGAVVGNCYDVWAYDVWAAPGCQRRQAVNENEQCGKTGFSRLFPHCSFILCVYLWLGLFGCCFFAFFHAGKFRIDENASAIFTHDYFLVHLYFHLSLRRYAVEAAAAGVALNVHDAQSVTCVLANALECR